MANRCLISAVQDSQPHPETESLAAIAARSRRQAMDWSLVLASQEIPTTIWRTEEGGWALLVAPEDHERAVASIRQFTHENRGWAWRQRIQLPELSFHFGGLVWSLTLLGCYAVTVYRLPIFHEAGRMDAAAVSAGEWWRVFTAMLLHADVSHLMANATFGFLLLGLAMAHYGAGLGILAAYIAGACGFGFGMVLHPEGYRSVGASGMVMAALGLMAVHSISHWKKRHIAGEFVVRTAAAGFLLFVLLGLDPSSDVVAHLGGFIGGCVLGTMATLLPEKVARSVWMDRVCGALLAALVIGTAVLALRAASITP